ncbi:hypothetical protein BDN71DRAFT_1431548 [Pleurotus eryngii]|uniref:Uncharacterized protein n=1 Tax=Pleurotus eryngii TaxID=5323 RepID=A0A9P5ZX61_PLEER|nr:hypothetical protein BDN71DRAFT_1431548 [Pleurotus eryngii]
MIKVSYSTVFHDRKSEAPEMRKKKEKILQERPAVERNELMTAREEKDIFGDILFTLPEKTSTSKLEATASGQRWRFKTSTNRERTKNVNIDGHGADDPIVTDTRLFSPVARVQRRDGDGGAGGRTRLPRERASKPSELPPLPHRPNYLSWGLTRVRTQAMLESQQLATYSISAHLPACRKYYHRSMAYTVCSSISKSKSRRGARHPGIREDWCAVVRYTTEDVRYNMGIMVIDEWRNAYTGGTSSPSPQALDSVNLQPQAVDFSGVVDRRSGKKGPKRKMQRGAGV